MGEKGFPGRQESYVTESRDSEKRTSRGWTVWEGVDRVPVK